MGVNGVVICEAAGSNYSDLTVEGKRGQSFAVNQHKYRRADIGLFQRQKSSGF